MTIHQIIFSPTGGTQRVSDMVCATRKENELHL